MTIQFPNISRSIRTPESKKKTYQARLHSGKQTQQLNIPQFQAIVQIKPSISHGHVWLPEGTPIIFPLRWKQFCTVLNWYPYFGLTVINWSHDFCWRSSGNCPLECSNLSICFFSWAWETVRKKKHSSGGGTTPEMKIQQANIGKTQGFNHRKFCFQGENMYKLDIDGIQTIKHRDLYQQLLLVVGGWSTPNS